RTASGASRAKLQVRTALRAARRAGVDTARKARTRAGLTQAQLAELIDTKLPVIARLEDADYEGHSFSMLRRIAKALGQRLEVTFVRATGTHGTRVTESRSHRTLGNLRFA
ncbi:MAG: XRE family transcriptional regulator, partial [Gammaproteobacteria bacterium]|nr:XRE family transcriptional regulator [Gammaproteobacteria bacterium]